MLSGQQYTDFNKNGFVLIRKFFETDEINNIKLEACKIFALQIKKVLQVNVDVNDTVNFEKLMYKFFEMDIDTFINCGRQVQQLIPLYKIGTESKIVQILKEIGLTFPILSVRPSMLFNSRHLAKKEDYWKLGAHQDWRSSQGSLDSVTIWFPLIDANTAIGALQVIPETHKLGLLDSEAVSYYGKIKEDFEDENFLQLDFEIGDVLLFSSFLVHRSGINTSESIRWSVQLRYSNIEDSTFIDRGFPNPFIYKPMPNLLTPGFPFKDQVLNLFNSR